VSPDHAAASTRRRGLVSPDHAEGGFTLIEVLVAITLIAIVMGALTTVFISVIAASGRQVGRQTAVQLGDDGVELVRALKGSAILDGRDQSSSDSQWASPVAGAGSYLADMTEAYDGTAAKGSGQGAALPTTAKSAVINSITYQQNWYVGTCWQPSTGGSCVVGKMSGGVAFYRVVVVVTWPDRHCSSTCSYATSTLVSAAASDPVFNANATASAPTVTNPGAQIGEVGQAVNRQMSATGGAPPITWSASGLPTGVSIDSSGLITGTPTTAGTYSVVVQAIDGFGLTGSAAFAWTINALPVLTNPGAIIRDVGTAATVTLATTGGTSPLTYTVTTPGGWGSTGLPPGLTLAASTGVISGTPTTAGTNTVTVTVTDAVRQTSSQTFTFTIAPAPTVQAISTQVSEVGIAASLQLVASDGSPSYTWSASGLPAGMTVASTTGLVSGKPTTTGTYSATVTAKDSLGATATGTFSWTVAKAVTVTTPPTQTSEVGVAASMQAGANNGVTAYSWSATGLPTGLSIGSATGLVTGTPTVSGTYSVKVTVKDSLGAAATTGAFTWTVVKTVTITAPSVTRTDTAGNPVTITAAAGNGVSPYRWTATGLPTGLSITSAGTISGTIANGTRFLATITVTDRLGGTTSLTLTWNVTAAAGGVRVTAPTGDRTGDVAGTAVTFTATATGGSGSGYTWTGTGLPVGVSITGTGVVSGTPTVAGTYTTTLTVTDSASKKAVYMFTWTVT
jgi:prepilin-type N-terminal cleavage/methylation domain-containing protein